MRKQCYYLDALVYPFLTGNNLGGYREFLKENFQSCLVSAYSGNGMVQTSQVKVNVL